MALRLFWASDSSTSGVIDDGVHGFLLLFGEGAGVDGILEGVGGGAAERELGDQIGELLLGVIVEGVAGGDDGVDRGLGLFADRVEVAVGWRKLPAGREGVVFEGVDLRLVGDEDQLLILDDGGAGGGPAARAWRSGAGGCREGERDQAEECERGVATGARRRHRQCFT